jgi:hypothetical protein
MDDMVLVPHTKHRLFWCYQLLKIFLKEKVKLKKLHRFIWIHFYFYFIFLVSFFMYHSFQEWFFIWTNIDFVSWI